LSIQYPVSPVRVKSLLPCRFTAPLRWLTHDIFNPLTFTVAIWYSYKALPDRVKPSFVIFDIRALWRARLSARVPRCQNYKGLAQDAL